VSTFERLYAVVVNWNGGAQNLDCLRSLTVAEGLPEPHIVFVDNGSEDGSRAAVSETHPDLRFLDHDTNLGFGEAANRGARYALDLGAAAVIFVNNDVTLPGGTLAALAAALDGDPRLGVVGPLVLFADPPLRVWSAGGHLDHRQNLSKLLGHGLPVEDRWRTTRDVDYVAGCALLARASVLEEVGLFDASYFAYHEDVDLCLRAQSAGHTVRVLGEVTVAHAPSSATGGGYSPRRKWMMGLNTVRFLRAHGSARAWLGWFVFDVLTLGPALLVGLFDGRWRGVLAKALGTFEGLLGHRVTAERLRPGASWLW